MENRSPLDLDPATMRQLGEKVTNLIVDHLSTLRQQPAITKHAGPADPVMELGDAPRLGGDIDALLETLREKVFAFHAREPHPGFMAYVPSCPTFPSLVGDWIATGFNFYAGVWPVATGPNRVELVVLDWFRRWLGMPDGSGGLLTTGGSAANLTAIVAARHHVTGGDPALIPKLVLYTSDQAHSSVARAGWMAGVARDKVRSVPSDADRRLDVTALAGMVAHDRAAGLVPCAVVASAGTTNTGAIDPLNAIADFCAGQNIWMHVDAAYGGFAVITERGRAALAGLERADSITLDPHKWLYVPFECGCLLVREPQRLYDCYAIFPEYLKDVQAGEGQINFADYGEQLTRYNRSLKVWMNVNYFGSDALASAIDVNMNLALRAERIVRETDGLELLSPAQLGIMCFRARPHGLAEGAELDRFNERVLAHVNSVGKYFISSTRLNGALALRICVLGFRTNESDIDGLLRECTRVEPHGSQL